MQKIFKDTYFKNNILQYFETFKKNVKNDKYIYTLK